MGDLNQFKKNPKKDSEKEPTNKEEEKTLPNIENFKQIPIFQLPTGEIINSRTGNS